MAVSINDIKKLRELTGAGLSDCKKALEETNCDFEKAMEEIRKKGKAVAAKREARDAAEGTVVAQANGGYAALIAFKCETDFVASNERFTNLAKKILGIAMEQKPATIADLLATKTDEGTLQDTIEALIAVTGEKMEIGAYETVQGASCVAYNHFNNKLSAIVAFNQEVDATVGKNIASQVAAMNPVAVNSDEVPQEVKDRELAIAVEKSKEEQVAKAIDAALKKAGINPTHVDSEDHIESNTAKGWITPEQAAQAREIKATVGAEKAASLNMTMIENIAKGRLNKFFKDNCLVEQEFVLDAKMTVKQYMDQASKGLTATAFKRVNLNQD